MKRSWLPSLDPQSALPLYEQIIEAVAIGVATRELMPGDPLPSVRTLAAELRINPNTSARALRELERAGLARAVRGIGTVVTDSPEEAARELARRALQRDLAAAVDVARRLGLTLAELHTAVEQEWERS